MKNKSIHTYQEVINQAINRLVVIITLSISLIILIVVGVQQSVMSSHDAKGLMMSLNRSNIESIPSFIEWNNETNRHTRQNTFIRVKTKNSSVTAASFKRQNVIMTTPSSKKFLSHKQFHLPFLTNVVYIRQYGLFLYYTQKNNKATYQLWVSLNSLLKNMLLLLIIISFTTFVTLGFGTWWAKRLAHRLSAPILSLANETKESTKDLEKNQPTLTIPDSPLEIKELGVSFNELLTAQNQRLQRERQFISDASHELKTPIAAIRGNIGLIKRRGDKHPEVIPESLDFIDEESLRMQNLIENLLHLSRADRAKIKLTSQNLSILVQNIGQHYQASIKQPLIYDIEDDLFVLGNEDMLQQILIALLDNACKYSPVDQPITLSLHKDNNNIELSVKDQGIGIEDDQKKKVFQRFYRVDQSHSTKIKGSGLGLAIVKQLVNLNHANISIEDNQPHGTIFKITFKNSK